jgi:hypothetical protein
MAGLIRGGSQINLGRDIKTSLQESLGGINANERHSGSLVESTNNPTDRKVSFADSEPNCEEMMEDDVDIRRKINQKLIRKYAFKYLFVYYSKNYFMYLMSNN